MRKKFYIIDGNAYVYRAFYAIPMLTTSKGAHVNALYGFLKILLKILNTDKPDYCVVCFDHSKKNFRHEMYSEYKATREKMPEELAEQIPDIKESVTALGLKIFEKKGYEADDLIATLAKKGASQDLDVYIVSGDKDVLQLVDEHITVLPQPKTNIVTPSKMEEDYGFSPSLMIDFLAITGDSSDNIPGVKGIGKVGAKDIITKYGGVKDILNNIDAIDPKYKDKIKANVKELKLSYDLIRLKDSIALEFDKESYKSKDNLERPDFKNFLEKFEFFKLLQSIYKKKSVAHEEENDICHPQEQSSWGSRIKDKACFKELDFSKFSASECSIVLERDEDEVVQSVVIYAPENEIFRLSIADLDRWQAGFKKILISKDTKIYLKDLKRFYIWAQKLFGDHTIFNTEYNIKFFDVVVAAHLLDSSMQDLDKIISKIFDKPILDRDLSIAVKAIFDLAGILTSKLNEAGLYKIYRTIEIPFSIVIASMELSGICIDSLDMNMMAKELASSINKLTIDIYRDSGGVFNLNSPKQLANVLFNKLRLPVLKKGKTYASTSEEVLKELTKFSDLPLKILKYRELNKLKSTYVDVLPNMVDKDSGRLHTSYNITGTTTGRLSSVNPNLQNIPIKSDLGKRIRRDFISQDGYSLVSADYSQIDLMVLAHISKDENMCKTFTQGGDIHTQSACKFFGKSEKEISDKERNIAKRINFGLIYGMGAFGLSRDTGIEISQAKLFIDMYFKLYSGVKDYTVNILESAKRDGYVTTFFGRKRYIPELRSKNFNTRMLGERMAINTPIQGSSSDIIKKAMVDLYNHFLSYDDNFRMLLQIHDEIIFEIKDEILKSCLPIIKEKMEQAVKLAVPLKVSIKTGKHWVN